VHRCEKCYLDRLFGNRVPSFVSPEQRVLLLPGPIPDPRSILGKKKPKVYLTPLSKGQPRRVPTLGKVAEQRLSRKASQVDQ
jgi:hypothetical protein